MMIPDPDWFLARRYRPSRQKAELQPGVMVRVVFPSPYASQQGHIIACHLERDAPYEVQLAGQNRTHFFESHELELLAPSPGGDA